MINKIIEDIEKTIGEMSRFEAKPPYRADPEYCRLSHEYVNLQLQHIELTGQPYMRIK